MEEFSPSILEQGNQAHALGISGNLRPYQKQMLFSPTGEGRQIRARAAANQQWVLALAAKAQKQFPCARDFIVAGL